MPHEIHVDDIEVKLWEILKVILYNSSLYNFIFLF